MPSPPASPSERPGEAGSALWTVALGIALVAIAASPRRRRSERDAEPEPERTARANGAHSHEGRTARWVAATQEDRGRAARDPTEIPAPGWKDIAFRVFQEFNKDRVLSVAAGVTFYTLLSLFPAVAALVTCYGLIADAGTINVHLASLRGVLPDSAIDIVGDQVKRIATKSGGTLGLTFFTTLLLSVWSANAAMKAMFDALNVVYEEQEKRNFFWLNLRSLTFTIGALLFVIIALSAIVVLPVVFNFVGLGDGAWALAMLRWPALLIVILGALTILYRYGPSREPARWRWVGVGGAIAGLLWVVASILFSWYVANFGSYNETYGSLGAVIGFMTWIWISATIVLLGGEINAEIEHQTAHDSTTGREKVLGERQARMADTVGAAA
ncbi:YihY/virulence factor BrkB family protein [Methylobacterium sp. C25]|uniref:YihY/virulence factor BrkB family protein n=1 Tax=Methylobacterium sp. C25 TaxID=2721622 RepID=UPI001F3C76C2|nr:YihY/virulence factor BrkB family protein [Methylobacterium sp. C25]MCE4222730.1 YihY/virulence factor BrkB family protein [Methylobacterium sp. C25]